MQTDRAKHPEPQKLLSPAEAANFLAVSERTLWSWTNEGRVACVKIDRTKRYRMQDLTNFIDANLTEIKSNKSSPE